MLNYGTKMPGQNPSKFDTPPGIENEIDKIATNILNSYAVTNPSLHHFANDEFDHAHDFQPAKLNQKHKPQLHQSEHH